MDEQQQGVYDVSREIGRVLHCVTRCCISPFVCGRFRASKCWMFSVTALLQYRMRSTEKEKNFSLWLRAVSSAEMCLAAVWMETFVSSSVAREKSRRLRKNDFRTQETNYDDIHF